MTIRRTILFKPTLQRALLVIVSIISGWGEANAAQAIKHNNTNDKSEELASKARLQIATNPNSLITLLNKDLAATNNSPELLFLLGRAYQETKQDVNALIYFTIAITKDPGHTKAVISRGLVRGALKDLEGAKKDFDQALLQDPRNTAALLNRGVTLGALGRAEEAIQDFSDCIKLQPKKPEAYRNRGISKFILGKQKEACIDWESAERLGDAEMKNWRSAYCKK
jgi:tetratricopeptide (TPR) repeat protein